MITFAGKPTTSEAVKGTLRMLRYYKRFLASDSDRCKDPGLSGCDGWQGRTLDKDGARRRLACLVNTAINRKAGVPDCLGRKDNPEHTAELWRDCRGVNDTLYRRVSPWGLNGYRWETQEIQKRYGYLFEGRDS